jgi:hypothetical protein
MNALPSTGARNYLGGMSSEDLEAFGSARVSGQTSEGDCNGRIQTFLSHFKAEAAAEARLLKLQLHAQGASSIFLDSDNLMDLRQLMTSVERSDTLLLLLTRGVLTRPWVLREIHQAYENNTLIVGVQLDGPGKSYERERDESPFLSDLRKALEERNPEALYELERDGIQINDLQAALQRVLPRMARNTFSTGSSERVQYAQVGDLITGIGLQSVGMPPPMPSCSQLRACICFHHDDALQEAAVFQKALHSLGCMDLVIDCCSCSEAAAYTELAPAVCSLESCQALIVLQTRHALSCPYVLRNVFHSLERKIPMVAVALEGKGYDFDGAQAYLSDLENSLRSPPHLGGNPAAAEVLHNSGFDLDTMSWQLSCSLPWVISKSFNAQASDRVQLAQAADIIECLSSRKDSVRPSMGKAEFLRSRSAYKVLAESDSGNLTSGAEPISAERLLEMESPLCDEIEDLQQAWESQKALLQERIDVQQKELNAFRAQAETRQFALDRVHGLLHEQIGAAPETAQRATTASSQAVDTQRIASLLDKRKSIQNSLISVQSECQRLDSAAWAGWRPQANQNPVDEVVSGSRDHESQISMQNCSELEWHRHKRADTKVPPPSPSASSAKSSSAASVADAPVLQTKSESDCPVDSHRDRHIDFKQRAQTWRLVEHEPLKTDKLVVRPVSSVRRRNLPLPDGGARQRSGAKMTGLTPSPNSKKSGLPEQRPPVADQGKIVLPTLLPRWRSSSA